jgi:bacillithiol biosynthesis cysteine-adding enzyme BshC
LLDGLPGIDAETRARIATRGRRPLAPDVHRALVAQNASLAPSTARDAHLAALATGAAAVVTGQQVGLFLGPLYTIYKAASATAIARALSAETGVPVVPVFWLQTEDHDVAEIAVCEVTAGTTCHALRVPVDETNRVSIAHLALPESISEHVATLAELLGAGPNAATHLERIRRHYRAGAGWATAFAGLLAELFAPEGLVVLDPRDRALATAAAPVHARAIEDAGRIADTLVARSRELEAAGRPPRVHVREGSPLSFFHPEGAHGPRVRLDASFDRRALLAALAADPLAFSTSALLRPILQDTLLPTAAYVGGPAEVAYFAQLPPLYRAFDLPLPLVIERHHFRIVDERAGRLLERLGIAARDLERVGEAELLARLRSPASVDVRAQLLGPFMTAHDALVAEQKGRRPAVQRALAKTKASVERSVGRLADKLARISAYEDAELVDSVRRARAWLAPDGEMQERRLGLPCFAARLGDRHVIERLLAAAAARPFEPALQELS